MASDTAPEVEAYRLVLKHFNGDKFKTDKWFCAHNPLLGELSPGEMILLGRGEKLLNFVQHAIAGDL